MPNKIQKVIEEAENALTLKFKTEEVFTSSGDYIDILEAPLPVIKSHLRTTISNVLQAIEEAAEACECDVPEQPVVTQRFTPTKVESLMKFAGRFNYNKALLDFRNLLKSARDSVK